jgi:hypothetical protein
MVIMLRTLLAISVSSTPPTWAGVITALATVITALGGLLVALTVFLPILRGTKENKVAIGAVHTIVNQQRTDAMNYQRALIKALHAHGVEVPEDQSVKENGNA